jgi:hypothetical protein
MNSFKEPKSKIGPHLSLEPVEARLCKILIQMYISERCWPLVSGPRWYMASVGTWPPSVASINCVSRSMVLRRGYKTTLRFGIAASSTSLSRRSLSRWIHIYVSVRLSSDSSNLYIQHQISLFRTKTPFKPKMV